MPIRLAEVAGAAATALGAGVVVLALLDAFGWTDAGTAAGMWGIAMVVALAVCGVIMIAVGVLLARRHHESAATTTALSARARLLPVLMGAVVVAWALAFDPDRLPARERFADGVLPAPVLVPVVIALVAAHWALTAQWRGRVAMAGVSVLGAAATVLVMTLA